MYTQISFFEEDLNYETFPHKKKQRPRHIQKDRKQDFEPQHQDYRHERRNKALKLNNVAVYALYDTLSDNIAACFIAPNDVAAERNYLNLITSPEANLFTLNPEDFELIKLSSDFEVIRKSTDYADTLLNDLRHQRAERFLCDSKEVKPDA